MRQVRMLASRYGSQDGFAVRYFERGVAYLLAESLACRFVQGGDACEINPRFDHINGRKESMTLSSHRLLTRLSGPDDEPLTLDEAKLYLRVDHEEEDDFIESLIVTARHAAELYLRRSLMTQEWKLAMDDELPENLPLPMGPVRAINAVTQFAQDGTDTVIDEDSYHLNAAQDTLVFTSQILAFRVEVEYETGYGDDAEDVPPPIRQGMLAHIAQLYDNRGDAPAGLPASVALLYQPYREISL